jgi:hypothetical protein
MSDGGVANRFKLAAHPPPADSAFESICALLSNIRGSQDTNSNIHNILEKADDEENDQFRFSN